MTMVERLLQQLQSRGLEVLPSDQPDTLILHGPASERTPEVMLALKKFKPELLQRFGRKAHAQQVQATRRELRTAGLVETEGH
jgi:hypothetical protein